MIACEYQAFCDYFIADYSREISENYGHSKDKSIQVAKHDLKSSFPNGLKSKDHTLLCIENNSIVIGYLWHSINIKEKSTFIYDFFIYDDNRSKGYGKMAIKELEIQLSAQGIKQIKLRVAYKNKRALKLYQDVGFTISGYNMSKLILKN